MAGEAEEEKERTRGTGEWAEGDWAEAGTGREGKEERVRRNGGTLMADFARPG